MNRFALAVVLTACMHMVQAQSVRIRSLPLDIVESAGEPFVASDRDGGFVLTWQARVDDGGTALRYRRIDEHGKTGVGGDIARGTGWFVNWADFPSLTVLDNGDWLAYWLERSGAGYAYDIRMTHSRNHGKSWSAPFTLHDDGTRSEHGFVAMAPFTADQARVVWLDGRHTAAQATDGHEHHHGAGAMSLRAAIVGRGGVSGSEQIDDRVCDCCQTDAVRVGRQTLVVYRDREDDEVRDVKFLRHDGERWHAPETVFDEGWRIAGCPVNGPAIAAHEDRIIVAGYSEADGVPSIRVRTSENAGRRWHESVRVAAGDTIGRLDVVALARGGFAVSRFDEVGDELALRLSLHDREGAVLETKTLVELPVGRMVGFPRMAANGDAILVAWTQPVAGKPYVRAAWVEVDPSAR